MRKGMKGGGKKMSNPGGSLGGIPQPVGSPTSNTRGGGKKPR